jgi:predicted DNA-binding transcriptional regulator YafY
MDTADTPLNAAQQLQSFDQLDESELLETSPDVQFDSGGPRYETTERILRLLHLLTFNDCTRQDIFERLKDYYKIDESDGPKVGASSQRAGRMLLRDIKFLERMGYEINKFGGRGAPTRYRLVKGSGPGSTFLFNQTELDTLALLHTLFADPTKYAKPDPTQPLPSQPPRNPFAEEILALIERLVATLPSEQRAYFDRWVRKPFVYLNVDTVTDYLPHRATIDAIVEAISWHKQIRFEYVPMHRRQGTTLHEHIDPYYIIHQDGHLYLIAYSHKMDKFYEYRIDRIKAGSIKAGPDRIDGERRRRPTEFSYWIDGSIAKSGLSQRWLSHTIEREEVSVDERGRQRHRVLVRAKAYSEWRILQQMHKYGDKAELVDPLGLREKMSKEVERIYGFYKK